MSERKGREFDAFIPESLYKRILSEIRREKYITPYTLAEKYNMNISLARQLLRRLAEEGVVKVYSYSRRAPIYVPIKK
ncbi:MAG: 30S ribosomal protein S25e [Pyrodictiaceae archaeon]